MRAGFRTGPKRSDSVVPSSKADPPVPATRKPDAIEYDEFETDSDVHSSDSDAALFSSGIDESDLSGSGSDRSDLSDYSDLSDLSDFSESNASDSNASSFDDTHSDDDSYTDQSDVTHSDDSEWVCDNLIIC